MHSEPDEQRWNHSIYYWDQLLNLIPTSAMTALDVGCGEGYFARSLARAGLKVTAIDLDAESIARARAQESSAVTYVVADVLTSEIARPFDVVSAVAVIHHIDLDVALTRLKELVTPGGILLIVGLAASRTPGDMVRDLAGGVASRVRRRGHEPWDSGSPTVWPPPQSYGDVAEAARRILPGSVFTRRSMHRYTLTWTKPDAVAS